MITTGHLRRKAHGGPQKLQVVKAGSNPYKATPVAPRPERDIASGVKIGGKMLVTGGMDDRVMNHKRKVLMEKVKRLKAKAIAQERIKSAQLAELALEQAIKPAPQPPPIIKIEVKSEPIPEKKKRGRPKKEDKETE